MFKFVEYGTGQIEHTWNHYVKVQQHKNGAKN
jgi:hypothetical protein